MSIVIMYALPRGVKKRFREDIIGGVDSNDKARILEMKRKAEATGYHSFRVAGVTIKGLT